MALLSHLKNSTKAEPIGEKKWRAELDSFCESHGLRKTDLKGPDLLMKSAWTQAVPERERAGLIAWSCVDHDMDSIDVSQGLLRMPRGRDGVFHTLIPKNRIFLLAPLVKVPRVLCGPEMLGLQGFPLARAVQIAEEPDMTDSLLKDLAGNAFSGTVFASVMLATILHLPASQVQFCAHWSRQVRATCAESDADAAAGIAIASK
jgi:hypothetical protein